MIIAQCSVQYGEKAVATYAGGGIPVDQFRHAARSGVFRGKSMAQKHLKMYDIVGTSKTYART